MPEKCGRWDSRPEVTDKSPTRATALTLRRGYRGPIPHRLTDGRTSYSEVVHWMDGVIDYVSRPSPSEESDFLIEFKLLCERIEKGLFPLFVD